MADSKSSTETHIVLFPFMSKGHTIPLLHLAKLIHMHRPTAIFTIFTITDNVPFITVSLSSLPPHLVNIVCLPFPASDPFPGAESITIFHDFANATLPLQTSFETVLEELRNHRKVITCLISDGFLHWTQQSASKFNIPRLVFYGMSSYAHTISHLVLKQRISFNELVPYDELIQVPDFPWVRVTKNDFESPFGEPEPKGPMVDFIVKCATATSKSHGLLINTFYELEPKFVDYWNSKFEPRSWPIGPFCLAERPKSERPEKSATWVNWLDQKQAERKPVLYIAFGSQAEICNEQLKEIIAGLEKSEANFLWALRIKPSQAEVMEGFEERVKDRGLVLRGWVEQREILEHEIIQGFLSHCGLNSMIESICAAVPILAWPMFAEQPLNARMVVEEIKVGLRVETHNGSVRGGFVEGGVLSKMVRELMGGERGKLVKNRVMELSEAAHKAVEEGGSSWHNMQSLLNELEATQNSASHENSLTSYKHNCFPPAN